MRAKAVVGLFSLVVFIAIIAVFVGYVASMGIRVGLPAKITTLSMDVPDINNLAVDSNVLLRGVPVGKVTGIETSIETAKISFYIEGQYEVPVDSDVRLENLSALGESYIELEPRSSGGPVLRDGQRISPESVKQPASISELATSVVRVFNQLDTQQLNRVIGEADAGLPDPDIVLPNLARASLLLRNTTADFKGQGQEMLSNFEVLLQNAGFVGPALADSTPHLRSLGVILPTLQNDAFRLGIIGSREQVLTFSAFIQRLQKFLDDRGPDLRILGEATSANVDLIAAALRNLDSSQILANLLATVPEDGAIDLHVAIPHG